MTTIDFTKIRSTPKSRNDSFEALAVQLFRTKCCAPAGSTFISLRGDGGDGGVEAFYRTPSGDVWGIQAKYFFQLGSSELDQIDSSLKTALINHPSLSQYWVYIPFDLTGRVAGGKRGKSQAERFEEWKARVESEAAARGKPLEVTLCTAAVICSQLQELDKHGGMLRYWFDDATLTAHQVEQCLEQAKAFAGPRYSAVLDVVTSAHIGLDFFGGIGNFQTWREEALVPLLKEVRSLQGYGDKALNVLEKAKQSQSRELIAQVVQVLDCINTVEDAAVSVERAGVFLSELRPLLVEAREAQENEFFSKHGEDSDTPGFRQFHAEYMCNFPAGEMDAARAWEKVCSGLQDALTSQELGAATTRSLLLVGPAGIGKTHAIVSAAFRRLIKGGLSLVVFGDDFGVGEPWEVLRSKLGFGGSLGRDSLFECLQACADHMALPFIVYIDALNESPRDARWKDKLPELLQQCRPYSGIKVCVSTRDTYRNLVVDSRFSGFAFEHVGFAGQEFEAMQAFAAFYGLDSEITPLFSTELSNPLFLHLACRTLKEEGRDTLDVSLPGFAALFESHLKHCDDLVRGRLRYANPRNLVRAAMLLLAETVTHALPRERTWEACTAALRSLVGFEITPEALLKELEHEGLIILTAGESDSWLLRLGYQRFGDVLRAVSLVESCKLEGKFDLPILASRLGTLTDEDAGLLEVLAAVLPEKTGVEITERKLDLDPEYAHRLFVQALLWRSRASVNEDVVDHIYDALRTPGLWRECYETFFRLSLVPGHKLNAENWLQPFMQRQPMVDRDVYLSIAAFKSFDENGAVRTLINAALRSDIGHWPAESRSLATKTLAWLTSCADRRVRDMAAKGLARIVGSQPRSLSENNDLKQSPLRSLTIKRVA